MIDKLSRIRMKYPIYMNYIMYVVLYRNKYLKLFH